MMLDATDVIVVAGSSSVSFIRLSPGPAWTRHDHRVARRHDTCRQSERRPERFTVSAGRFGSTGGSEGGAVEEQAAGRDQRALETKHAEEIEVVGFSRIASGSEHPPANRHARVLSDGLFDRPERRRAPIGVDLLQKRFESLRRGVRPRDVGWNERDIVAAR